MHRAMLNETTSFLHLLSISKLNASQNSYSKYKKFLNSKLANWPKRSRSQILFHENISPHDSYYKKTLGKSN